jgi:pimeloyl-ACP methyl ester carboxylesterase
LLTAILATACGSVELRPEADIPGMAFLQGEAGDMSRQLEFIDVGDGDVPLKIAIEEVAPAGSQDPDGDQPVIVLIHGVLSNRLTWQYVVGKLGKDYRLLLVDLPGCGSSDKPDSSDPDAYTPRWLAEKVLLALRGYFATGNRPSRLVLVGHSLGGTVILRMLGNQELRDGFPDIVDLVDRTVLISAVDPVGVPKPDPLFEQIATTSDFEIILGKLFGILWSSVAQATWDGSNDPRTAPLEEAERLYDILGDGATRTAAQAMILRTVAFNADRSKDWLASERQLEEYGRITTPSLIVWGERDGNFSVSMGHLLRNALPNAWLRTIPSSMHTLPGERPRIVAHLIAMFADADPAQLTATSADWDQVLSVPLRWVEASDQRKLGLIEEADWDNSTVTATNAIYRR